MTRIDTASDRTDAQTTPRRWAMLQGQVARMDAVPFGGSIPQIGGLPHRGSWPHIGGVSGNGGTR